MSAWKLGIIGGSGLYEIDELEDPQWRRIDSPWGEASDELLSGTIGETPVVFLPRHGRGHRLAPAEVNARANIDALKRAGCTDILSISAVGSLREDMPPGSFALVRQYVDRTVARPSSFFGEGVVAHVSMADPVCDRLSGLTLDAARAASRVRPDRRSQTGSAIDTWATTPSPKKEEGRATVRSTYWRTRANEPGGMSSRSDPTAEIDRMSVQPARFSASMLARALTSAGASRCPRPWRGRKTTGVSPIVPDRSSSDASPQGLSIRRHWGSSSSSIS